MRSWPRAFRPHAFCAARWWVDERGSNIAEVGNRRDRRDRRVEQSRAEKTSERESIAGEGGTHAETPMVPRRDRCSGEKEKRRAREKRQARKRYVVGFLLERKKSAAVESNLKFTRNAYAV